MEIIVAFGIPEGTPFLALSELMHLASTSAVSIRLVAIGAIILEALIDGAVLPADGANTRVAILAIRVAKSTIFLFIVCAGGERLASCAAVGLLPARVRHISVMVIVMEVMNWCAIVVLLGVSKRLFRVSGEVGHMLLVLIVRVVSSLNKWVFVLTVEATVMHRTVIREFFVVNIDGVVNDGMGHNMMFSIQTLHVVVIMDYVMYFRDYVVYIMDYVM